MFQQILPWLCFAIGLILGLVINHFRWKRAFKKYIEKQIAREDIDRLIEKATKTTFDISNSLREAKEHSYKNYHPDVTIGSVEMAHQRKKSNFELLEESPAKIIKTEQEIILPKLTGEHMNLP